MIGGRVQGGEGGAYQRRRRCWLLHLLLCLLCRLRCLLRLRGELAFARESTGWGCECNGTNEREIGELTLMFSWIGQIES